MKTDTVRVDDTSENLEICRKYCGACPTFKNNNLGMSPPHELFCARGRSAASEQAKPGTCFCPACEVFGRYHLTIGHFCTQ